MKSKNLIFRSLVLIPFFVLGCSFITDLGSIFGVGGPEFINYPRPELTVDFSPLEDLGCSPDEVGTGRCDAVGVLAELGCDRVVKPPDLLGGLTPNLPIGLCLIEPLRDPARL